MTVITAEARKAWVWAEQEAERLGVITDELLNAMRFRGWLIHQIERLEPEHIHRLKEPANPDPAYQAKLRRERGDD